MTTNNKLRFDTAMKCEGCGVAMLQYTSTKADPKRNLCSLCRKAAEQEIVNTNSKVENHGGQLRRYTECNPGCDDFCQGDHYEVIQENNSKDQKNELPALRQANGNE